MPSLYESKSSLHVPIAGQPKDPVLTTNRQLYRFCMESDKWDLKTHGTSKTKVMHYGYFQSMEDSLISSFIFNLYIDFKV